jgi:cation:H+ antiporter
MTIFLYALTALVASAVIWKGSGWLESSSERLSTYYELPPIIQGAVVVAMGSSFPEFTTAVFSTLLHGEFELGVAAIVGSALFNVLMVPALSGLWAKDVLNSNRTLVYKEAQFYLISIAVLLLVFSFAVIYNPVDGLEDSLAGEVTRLLALFPLGMYGLYVFVQYQDTMDYVAEDVPTDIRPGREWAVLLGALVTILIGVEGLVRAAIRFGNVFGTPSFLWGITVVAAGTSVPDAFVSIQAARHGNTIASVANVLGSNIFDLLVCIPAGVLIAGTVVINYSIAAPLMAVLTAATLVIFLMMRTDLVVSRREAWGLIALYILFVGWMVVETFDVVDFVPTLPPGSRLEILQS